MTKKNSLDDAMEKFRAVSKQLGESGLLDDNEDIKPNVRKSRVKKSEKTDSLAGKCLVRLSESSSDMYNHAVIYITECTASKVRGIMINKLMFGTAAIECKSKEDNGENALKNVYEDLYQGGPENPAHGFVLFPREECVENDPFAEVLGDVAISTSFGVLQEILEGEGPEKKIIAMGHCAWNRGELEWEIFNNKWLVVPTNLELMFETDFSERWAKAAASSGVNLKTYMPQIGLA
ncbi:MAG: YqgE/AlgH family protein [Alphaproteobacteria bacterium]|nr:YqgE/AlgH family protein [Alphaproteobacteria bacterium]MBO5441374.1 YqgE/AlgH family protein [Alphaproteobacteria bacterium]